MRRAAGPQGYRHATCPYRRHKGSSVHGLPAQKRRRLRPGSGPRSRLLGAHAAPFIMMSQNRQQDIDRKAAEHDYQINIKAELEIELLHQKIDELREKEVLSLSESIQQLIELLRKSNTQQRTAT